MKMFNKTCTKVVDDDDDDGGKVDDKMNRDANLINYHKKKLFWSSRPFMLKFEIIN